MLVLYIGDKHFSGWSMRGRILLMEKGIEYEERLVELDWPTTETSGGVMVVGDGNPEREAHAGCECETADIMKLDRECLLAGTHVESLPRVPILVDTETKAVVSDVVAIAEYLDEAFPDVGARFLGHSATVRSGIRSVSSWAYHDLGALVYGASYARSLRKNPGVPEPEAFEQCNWICDIVGALLEASGSEYLFGEFSLADAMLSTYFQQMRGWGYRIDSSTVAGYSLRLLSRQSVQRHIHEASRPYQLIEDAEPGTPTWVVRHYRLHEGQRLLHEWQLDHCVKIKNDTAMLAVDLAYAGKTRDEIVAKVSDRYKASPATVADDMDQLFADLAAPLVAHRKKL